MHDIKNDIKNKIFANVYILTGEEDYLPALYTRQITDAVTDEDTKEFNLLEVYSTLPAPEDIDAFANSYPFMSEKKVLVIQDTKIFKKANEEYKNFFIELIANIPDYLIIIFNEKEIDKRNTLYKQISKIYPVCEYAFQDIPTLTAWITKLFTASGKTISRDDAVYICEAAGPSMHALKSEAEKIISALDTTDTADRQIIDTLITRTIENRVFEMIDDITSGKNSDALKKLRDLKALNEEPIKIINIIFGKFSTFHKLLLLKDKSMREICTLCNLYEKHARNNLAQAKKLGARKIASVMLKCRDMDFAVKNGQTDKWLAAELVVAEALKD